MERPKYYSYLAVMQKEENGWYSVRFPRLDGCYTDGRDFPEAHRNAADALSLYMYTLEQDGLPIPESDLGTNYAVADGESVVAITAWMTMFRDEMRNRMVKKTLTIPAWLNEAGEKLHVNFSQLLTSALKDYISANSP